ncbi:DUF4153 domain-containing protein [Tabrizicola aquatica]|uniref:DUF4153 domain-containing protein n=1 Tax=Tabrizicola aquatica TaxID=909926 RepID=UPI0015E18F18|nr:DUF4153 domain-containing protein [Tabrizicola aquatica]
MTGALQARWTLTLVGALGGVLAWALVEATSRGLMDERPALALSVLVAVGFAATLAMAGPIGLARAAPRGAALGVVVGGLTGLSLLRYALVGEFLVTPMPGLAVIVLATLPVPFLIAAAQPGWRDYPALFQEAWSILVRLVAALAFTGLVWLVVLLSDAVLQIVGLDVIAQLLDHGLAGYVLTGAALGLGTAVVWELAGPVAPQLILRFLRLLLPVVLAVTLVFLAALPFRGLQGLVTGVSPALLLLTMVGAGIALVSVAVDRSDADAVDGPLLLRATQAMALILPILAALALWALWLRVDQRGWTPERLFLSVVALIGLGYGLTYAVSVLRGASWMARIRRGNLAMALVVIVAAALWLTPLFNAEAISARDQLARYEAGRTPVAELDLWTIGRWGRPGEAAVARLTELASQPGHEALAALLAGTDAPTEDQRAADQAALAALIPLQPPTATGTRDMLLAAAEGYQLRSWIEVCSRTLETGQPACVLVVADLLPAVPGEEAMLFLEHRPDWAEVLGLYLDADGRLAQRAVTQPDLGFLPATTASELLRAAQAAPLPLTPALVNQLGTGEGGLLMVP